MISLDRVSVGRSGVSVLTDVSLTVSDERVVVIGPSGSGKSTLLRAVLGLVPLSGGTIRIGDRVVSEAGRVLVPPEDRRVAMVFQDLALWPHLSVHGQLAFALGSTASSRRERERRIAEALDWVGLADKPSRLPADLSGGERQRVAIARALVLAPVAILLDEPLASLDVVLRRDITRLLVTLFAERRLPAIYVTHDPLDARALGDRIVALEHGRVVQIGTREELASDPETEFVEVFARGMGRGEGGGVSD